MTRINSTVVTQHAENAAFLWLLRNGAVHEPHYALKDLAKLDGRVDANLDGLRIAGEAGWNICNEFYAWDQPGEIFAAGVMAFENSDQTKIDKVLELGTQTPELMHGLISALGWLNPEQALPHIQELLASELTAHQTVGIGAAALHRHALPGLGKFLQSSDALLKARALSLTGELGDRSLAALVTQNIYDEDEACRYWAACSSTLLGFTEGISVLHQTAAQGGDKAEQASDLACRAMPPAEALAWQKDLAAKPETLRLAIKAAASIGDPILIPWIIGNMYNPEQTKPAGEAFSMITGVDIAYEDLDGELPGGFNAGPNDDPEDDNVALDADENLACPNPDLIQKWWSTRQKDFTSGKRYLLGKPIASNFLQAILREGRQRQRYAAALELVLLNPGQPLFEVRAPGWRQKQMLGLK